LVAQSSRKASSLIAFFVSADSFSHFSELNNSSRLLLCWEEKRGERVRRVFRTAGNTIHLTEHGQLGARTDNTILVLEEVKSLRGEAWLAARKVLAEPSAESVHMIADKMTVGKEKPLAFAGGPSQVSVEAHPLRLKPLQARSLTVL
jgi:hypothetical protein